MRRNSGKKGEAKYPSCISIFSWVVIIMWMIFLLAVALTGNVHSDSPRDTVEGITKYIRGAVHIDRDNIHIVFATDCGSSQNWQSLLLFHSALQVKQVGHITRIASGCTQSEVQDLSQLYRKISPSFSIHSAPDFKTGIPTGVSYNFNTPIGVLHWLDHADPPIPSETVVAIIESDFIFLRPLVTAIAGQPNTLITAPVTIEDVVGYIERGRAVGQHSGLGAAWVDNQHVNRTGVCLAGSACLHVTRDEGSKYYSVVAPYMLERDDMHRVVSSWVEFWPRVHESYPDVMAEAYAYSMSAAHNRLPHLQLDHFIVSNVDMDQGEGWQWIDALEDDTCVVTSAEGIFYPDRPMPTFVHYRHTYTAGELGFSKGAVDFTIFNCEADMLLDSPADLGSVRFAKIHDERIDISPKEARRNSFVICIVHNALNAALIYYKDRMCTREGQQINNAKTASFLLSAAEAAVLA